MSDYQRYLDQATYQVGQPFPFANPQPGQPGSLLISAAGFINLVLFTDVPEADQQALATQELTLSVFETDVLPFVLLAVPTEGLFMDFFFNGARITPEGWEAFRNTPTPEAMIMLVDAQTNELLLLRVVPLPVPMAAHLKYTLGLHRDHYADEADQLDQRAAQIIHQLDPLSMWQTAIKNPNLSTYSPPPIHEGLA
ncbi:hypothetical protein [Spirosoma sordidisoli]|uniref:Uncharacterized protein n=1 Tax=Spirosoma sordidisoli TaxID=2502893 RepID=A0A4V1RVC7_9BACT|nr:hypothetical protein [Spirosoma sordidisoli]RYC66308.1 hypothetical protein EQG79_29990 [Spirosoma sordidisoli]